MECKPELGVIHELLPNDLAGALAETNDSMTTPLVVFDRRALRIQNFENTGFVTVAGQEVPDSEVDAVCGAKIGSLPKLHNWNVPDGRTAYASNVASIVVGLEAQLLRRQMGRRTPCGEAIPGLSGAGNV
jgi:hypothetical protein